ncbi:MAG TPA: hypothetical protein VNQ90_11955 [Chthoniobacteraceae bacterium]|nr:hypothetical protein [Chthoniobacteraceae bacterium]
MLTEADTFQWVIEAAPPGQLRRGLATWQAYDAASRVDLTASALLLGESWLVIDPIPLAPAAFERLLQEMAPAQAVGVVLTSANHERSARWWAGRLSVPLHAHPEAAPAMEGTIDMPCLPGQPLFAALEVVPLPGAAPGEIALYDGAMGGLWIIGDALIHLEATGLCFLPDRYCSDPGLLRQSARALLERPFRTVAFAHGPALTADAFQSLSALIPGEKTP